MTAISIRILKIDETSEWAKYAFGGPPKRVLGHVAIYKSDGHIELLDIIDNKYKKHILPSVIKKLTEHYEQGDYPDSTFYAS